MVSAVSGRLDRIALAMEVGEVDFLMRPFASAQISVTVQDGSSRMPGGHPARCGAAIGCP